MLLGSGHGYPRKETLQKDQKLLKFYTVLTNFSTLMALFNFVVKVLPVSANSKLSSLDSFLLTKMKLRTNISNQDLVFRFQISPPTVNRIFKKWIGAMYHRLKPALIQ